VKGGGKRYDTCRNTEYLPGVSVIMNGSAKHLYEYVPCHIFIYSILLNCGDIPSRFPRVGGLGVGQEGTHIRSTSGKGIRKEIGCGWFS
jgi:hypothetical protein